MRRWSAEGKRQSEIAALLGRSSKAVSNHLQQRGMKRVQKGRPRKMTRQVYTGLRRVLTRLLKKAGGEKVRDEEKPHFSRQRKWRVFWNIFLLVQ